MNGVLINGQWTTAGAALLEYGARVGAVLLTLGVAVLCVHAVVEWLLSAPRPEH